MSDKELALYHTRDHDYSVWILGRYGHGKPLAKPSISSHHAEWTEAIAKARAQ